MAPRIPPPTIGDAIIAIRDMRAPWIEQRHTTVLCMVAARLPKPQPSQAKLADDCHMSLRATSYTLGELRKHGVMAFDGGKTGKRITYSLVMPAILALGKGTQPMLTSPPEGTQPMRTQVSSPCVPPTQPMLTAKSQGKIQLEGDPERAQGSLGTGTARKGGRPPLPSLPAAHARPHLQPVAPRRPLRACKAPVSGPDTPATPIDPPGHVGRQEGHPAAVG